MVPNYQTGSDVTVSVDYPMDGSMRVSPVSVAYTVLDENGAVILERADVPAGALENNKVTLTIPGANNVVPDGKIRTLRNVRVFFVKANDTEIAVTSRYSLSLLYTLILMTNSFQSYEQAILTRLDMPSLDGWDVASEDQQVAAMITAYDRMCRLTYRYKLVQDVLGAETIDGLCDPYSYISNIRECTPDDWADFPSDFQRALMRAQVYEADTILGGDPVANKRAQGIVSETTGEAKMFFVNKPPVRFAVSKAALDVLGPYLFFQKRIARS